MLLIFNINIVLCKIVSCNPLPWITIYIITVSRLMDLHNVSSHDSICVCRFLYLIESFSCVEKKNFVFDYHQQL